MTQQSIWTKWVGRILLALNVVVPAFAADTISGKVVGVADGGL